MSLFGSLYTGAAGMLAQERSTAVISENIANINTTGFKRQDTAFHELVSNSLFTTSQNGSVSSSRINRIDQQGAVSQTGSGSDLAIIGDGFFAVRPAGAMPDDSFLYTRNGTFQEDQDGVLTNSAGFQLYGWPIDQNGVVASGTDTTSLQLVDIDLFQTQVTPSTFGELAINLNSDETPINPHALVPAQELPVSNQAINFSRSVAVYDAAGTERRVNFEFRRTIGPMAHFTSDLGSSATFTVNDILVDNATGLTPGINAGEMLQIDDGTNTLDVMFVAAPADTSMDEANTMLDLLTVINGFTDVNGDNPFTARITDDGRFLVQANDTTVTLDITGSDADVLGATGFNFVLDPDDGDNIYDPDADILVDGTANPNQTSFPDFADTATPNPFNWWEVTVTTIDPANPTGTATVEVAKGLLNFDGTGALNAVTDANGQALLDLGTLTFDNTDATSTVTMNFDIANFTQFSGDYNVLLADQNGAPLGEFSNIDITRDGIVEAVFSNGERVPSFQIPLADFTNVNGLERISGTAFAETEASGAVSIFDAGTGGTGILQVASLESSNVDLSNEFSLLIVSQRAFGLNSQVISKVDEMTQDLARLKR